MSKTAILHAFSVRIFLVSYVDLLRNNEYEYDVLVVDLCFFCCDVYSIDKLSFIRFLILCCDHAVYSFFALVDDKRSLIYQC